MSDPRLSCQEKCTRRLLSIDSPKLGGVGPRPAKIMLVGEAPGQEEDAKGVPFIGTSGKLLNEILTEVGLNREEIYITNSVKCATPDENNKPSKKELNCCRCFLEEEIKKVKPNVIGVLGAVALEAVLKRTGITKLNNTVLYSSEFKTKVVPVYHPAYILRNPSAYDDLKKGIEIIKREAESRKPAKVAKIPTKRFHADTSEKIDRVLEELSKQKRFVFDLETSALDPLVAEITLIAISWRVGLGVTIPWKKLSKKQKEKLQEILCSDKLKGGHNLKFDIQILRKHNIKVTDPIFDCLPAIALIDENIKEKGLDALTLKYTDLGEYWTELDEWKQEFCRKNKIKEKDFSYAWLPKRIIVPYAQNDADSTYRIMLICLKELIKQELLEFYHTYTIPTLWFLLEVEYIGILVNRPYLKKLGRKYLRKIDRAFAAIYDEDVVKQYEKRQYKRLSRELEDRWKGSKNIRSRYSTIANYVNVRVKSDALSKKLKFNPRSPLQLREILFKILKLEVLEKTKTKLPSTRFAVMEIYARQSTIANKIINHRKLTKFFSTYIKAIYVKSKIDGRVHPNYLQFKAVTGRLCVAGDTKIDTNKGTFCISKLKLNNLQNLMVKTHLSRWKRITNKIYKGKEQLYRVTLSNGCSIKCTKGHSFLTPHGWKKLNELAIGSSVISDKTYSVPNRTIYEDSHQEILYKESNKAGDKLRNRQTQVWNNIQNMVQLNKILQERIFRRVAALETYPLFTSPDGKHPRETRSTKNRIITEITKEVITPRLYYSPNSKKAENNGVVRMQKLSTASASESLARKRAAARGGILSRQIRKTGSWNKTESCKIPRRSPLFFSRTTQSVYGSKRDSLVYKKEHKKACALYFKEKNTEGSYLLVSKPFRTTVIKNITGKGSESHTAIQLLQKLPRGLLFSENQDYCRNKRGVSSEASSNNSEGQVKIKNSKKIRLQNNLFFKPRSVERPISNCTKNTISTIRSIKKIGRGGVWDITVQDDHSYLAHGFINHNSCANPNFQNLPRGAKDLKKALLADPGMIVVKADLKQAEFRCWAHYSKDPQMIKDIEAGLDIHRRTAATVFGVKEEDVTDEQRTAAKACVFGLMFGRGAKAIAKQYGIPLEKAEAVRELFFKEYPMAARWLDLQVQYAMRHGHVKTWLGRIRRLPEIAAEDEAVAAEAARQAKNSPIQGLASDMNNHFMVTTLKMAKKYGIKCYPMATIHDANVIQVKIGQEKKLIKLMKWVVHHAFPGFRCRMDLDFDIGKSLGDMEKVD